jgi:hypothetical protein
MKLRLRREKKEGKEGRREKKEGGKRGFRLNLNKKPDGSVYMATFLRNRTALAEKMDAAIHWPVIRNIVLLFQFHTVNSSDKGTCPPPNCYEDFRRHS